MPPTGATLALDMDARTAATARLRAAWHHTLYLLVSFPLGIFSLCLLSTALATGLGLVIVWVGVPILAATVVVTRWLAAVERFRVKPVLGQSVPAPYAKAPEGSVWVRVRTVIGDAALWKDLAWLLVVLPVLGTLGFCVAVALWSAALSFLTLPAWVWALPKGAEFGLFTIETAREAAPFVPLGAVLCVVTPLLLRPLARGQANLARLLLGPSERQLLAQRVGTLTRTRAGAVDAQAAELQRIERDLHDGAQARLVALAIDLGMAQEKFESDPAAASALITEAHAEAKQALVELRDLARGIYPAILTDRGLSAALSSVAARSPVPVDLDVDIPGRLPAATEAAAYFVAVEALTNVAKHSGARRAHVRAEMHGAVLHVTITDDGAGGADPAGRGLGGLRSRAEALDGRLIVEDANPGTRVRAELP